MKTLSLQKMAKLEGALRYELLLLRSAMAKVAPLAIVGDEVARMELCLLQRKARTIEMIFRDVHNRRLTGVH